MPAVLKTAERESVPWVRIPPCPPSFDIASGVMAAQVVFITNERFDSATQKVCLDSSGVEREPAEFGVGGSIPSPGTI